MEPPAIRILEAARPITIAALATLTVSCGGKRPAEPTPPVTVSSIAPASGPSVGGTPVTVTGENFAPGALLTIGSAAAQNVTVIDSTTIGATTAPSVSGTADVVVVSGGQTATLRSGYTYIRVENAPPVISSVTAQGSKHPNQPPRIADLDEEINVTANVSDAETPADQLTFEWTGEAGSFSGTGRSVRWRAPRDLARTPVSFTLTLTVVESYQSTDENGAVVTLENRVTSSVSVRVHNAYKEVSDLTGEFLRDFSNSMVSPENAVRNFSSAICPDGKGEELGDIRENRATRIITKSDIGTTATVTFNFSGTCPFRLRRGDACIRTACGWTSTLRSNGTTEVTSGTCHLTGVYDMNRWQMCWSDYQATTPPGLRFPF